MKYIKKASMGKFLKKGNDIKDGDMITIASEGRKEEGQFGPQDIFLMKLKNEEEGNISINQTSLNNWIDAWGDDSVNWIGKEVKVMTIRQNVQGKFILVYYFLHPDTTLDDESGQFVLNSSIKPSKDEIPVIEANTAAQEASVEDMEQ